MRSATARVALLLFASGFCALVYQTAWLRMFRMIFGASTAASAAVLAIFMAGLGFGALLTTFFALETLGVRKTIWIAALLNLLVVLAARGLAREMSARAATAPEEGTAGEEGETAGPRPGLFAPFAAALVGFAFLLMELVWYRMLGPLLGGSSYTFGLILAVALLGIGLGGLLYGLGEGERRPTLL